MDDFGTGYSSLSYLSRLPLDSLKIDRSFLTDIGRNHENKSIVTTILALARNLRLNVVAEGVEKSEQAAYLLEQGCEEAQGYYYSRPLPAEDVTRLLSARTKFNAAAGTKPAG
ncbi:EAL domain-containing protein [Paenibacillus thermoaerophilus]|uniref:EAL domain-containing protein n=1 Tax=Paenibacillus thermoaerophilus TaxID=1215385 RepID=UPI003CCC7C67